MGRKKEIREFYQSGAGGLFCGLKKKRKVKSKFSLHQVEFRKGEKRKQGKEVFCFISYLTANMDGKVGYFTSHCQETFKNRQRRSF